MFVLGWQPRENSIVFICPKLRTTLKMEDWSSSEMFAHTILHGDMSKETEIFVSLGEEP
jgi:hypothetical protein